MTADSSNPLMAETVESDIHPVLRWLDGPPSPPQVGAINLDQLVRWLQGDDGATAGGSLEPHEWIVGAMRNAAKPGEMRRRLAAHCRELLEQRLDCLVATEGIEILRRPGRYFSNLLWLCSNLLHPELLWEPLLALHNEGRLPPTLGQDDLVDPLRAALMMNQCGPELEPDWFEMLSGNPTRLEGTRTSGLRGVIYMPESLGCLGRPWVPKIARALGLMAHYLETFQGRKRKDFRVFVAEARKPYRESLSDYQLFMGAVAENWPVWAVEANWLYIRVPKPDNSLVCAWLWKYIAACIPANYGCKQIRTSFGGDFCKVELSGEALQSVDRYIAPLFTEHIRNNPFSSAGAMFCVVLHVMDILEKRARLGKRDREADTIRAARGSMISQVYSALISYHPDKASQFAADIEDLRNERYDTQDLTSAESVPDANPELMREGLSEYERQLTL